MRAVVASFASVVVLVERTYASTLGVWTVCAVIPISEHQDTVGPMARSVTDAAIILSAMAGRDPRDNATLAQPPVVPDYTAALDTNGLSGKRLGVPRKFFSGLDSVVVAAFNASLETMKGLGATIVDPADFPDFDELAASNNESIVLSTDFKVRVFRLLCPVAVGCSTWMIVRMLCQVDVNRYISELVAVPTGVQNLADLIAFNTAHADEELVPPFWTDQSQYARLPLLPAPARLASLTEWQYECQRLGSSRPRTRPSTRRSSTRSPPTRTWGPRAASTRRCRRSASTRSSSRRTSHPGPRRSLGTLSSPVRPP